MSHSEGIHSWELYNYTLQATLQTKHTTTLQQFEHNANIKLLQTLH